MSRLQKVKEHNKNVLAAISILLNTKTKGILFNSKDRDAIERLKSKFVYINTINDFIDAKKAFVTFFDKLLDEYNVRVALIGQNIETLNKQKEDEKQAPAKIKELKEEIQKLVEFTNTKDVNYERCVKLFERKQQCLKDLEAMEKYTVTEYENKREPRSETYFQMTYDPSTKTSRMMPMTRIVYVTKRVEKTVVKERPDEAKRARARAELQQIEQEAQSIPTYDHNIKVYEAFKKIDELNKKIKEIENFLATAKEKQEALSAEIQDQIDVANKLKEILTKEKELIEVMIKDPDQRNIGEIEDVPER